MVEPRTRIGIRYGAGSLASQHKETERCRSGRTGLTRNQLPPHFGGRGFAPASAGRPAYAGRIFKLQGGMTEWSNVPHSKCGVPETVPGVRIPLPPPKMTTLMTSLMWSFLYYRDGIHIRVPAGGKFFKRRSQIFRNLAGRKSNDDMPNKEVSYLVLLRF